MVGEIRDAPTAALAIRAALTGHLVLTTVHTNDAASIVTRFVNLGVEPFLLSSVLRGGVAQRLVRRLCERCKQRREATAQESALAAEASFELDFVWEATGCDDCNGSGYLGRFALAEPFDTDDALRRIINESLFETEIRGYFRSHNVPSLLYKGCVSVGAGETTLVEIERAVST